MVFMEKLQAGKCVCITFCLVLRVNNVATKSELNAVQYRTTNYGQNNFLLCQNIKSQKMSTSRPVTFHKATTYCKAAVFRVSAG